MIIIKFFIFFFAAIFMLPFPKARQIWVRSYIKLVREL